MNCRRELESLIDTRSHSPALAGDHHVFGHVPEDCWTSTTSVYEPRYAWVVCMQDGAVGVGWLPGLYPKLNLRKRGVIRAIIQTSSGSVNFFNTHLSLFRLERWVLLSDADFVSMEYYFENHSSYQFYNSTVQFRFF